MNETIRRFTKGDWHQWAEAEEFKNGSDPFIFESERNGVELTIIGDVRGIEIEMHGGEGADEEQDIWVETIENATQSKIKDIMERIIKRLNLDGDWYAPDVSYAFDHAFSGITKV